MCHFWLYVTLFYVHSRLTVPTLSLLLDAPMVPILKTLHRLVVESSHSRTQVSTHRRTLVSAAFIHSSRTRPPNCSTWGTWTLHQSNNPKTWLHFDVKQKGIAKRGFHCCVWSSPHCFSSVLTTELHFCPNVYLEEYVMAVLCHVTCRFSFSVFVFWLRLKNVSKGVRCWFISCFTPEQQTSVLEEHPTHTKKKKPPL